MVSEGEVKVHQLLNEIKNQGLTVGAARKSLQDEDEETKAYFEAQVRQQNFKVRAAAASKVGIALGVTYLVLLARAILRYYMSGKSTTALLQVCADALAVALVKERDAMQLDGIKSKHVDVLDTTLTAIRNTRQSHFNRSWFRKALVNLGFLLFSLNTDTAASEMAESAAELFEQPKLLKQMAEKTVEILTTKNENIHVTLKEHKGRLVAKLTLIGIR